MRNIDFLTLINDLENKFPVDTWVIDSFHIWPILRLKLYFDLRDHLIGKQPHPQRYFSEIQSLLGDWAQYLHAYLSDHEHNTKLFRADFLFVGDQVSRAMVNATWYDRLCQPVQEELAEKNLESIHLDPHHNYRIPRHNKSMFIQLGLDVAVIRDYIFCHPNKNLNISLPKFSEYIQYLNTQDWGIKSPDINEIKKVIFLIRAYTKFFAKVLSIVQPKIGFLVEYYNPVCMAFNNACHNLGIKTIEIPHGNHGEIHGAYCRWNKVPECGYELLPSVFWCWSEHELNIIQQWTNNTSGHHKAVLGGNPWLKIWKEGTSDFVPIYDEKIKSIKSTHPNSLHILLTYEHDIPAMFELIKAAPASFCWWIRLHPCQLPKRKEWEHHITINEINNCEFGAATDFPLYALLRHMDVHVTECSSTVIETEHFGVPSVITKDYGAVAFPQQLNSGWTVAAYTNAEIIQAIRDQYERREALRKNFPIRQPVVSIEDFLNNIEI